MPQHAAASAPFLPMRAHRPEPIEPPTAPPTAPPNPGEPDTVPGPTPEPIDPDPPMTPPIGDPPAQPTQTPQAGARPPMPMQCAALTRRAEDAAAACGAHCRSRRADRLAPRRPAPTQCGEFMYLLQDRRIFYRQFTVALPRL